MSFDDDDSSVFDNAFSYMSANGIKGTHYIISANIGVGNAVTAGELQTERVAGWTIGNHTQNHVELNTLTEAEQEAELSGCDSDLQAIGIDSGKHVAYPYGAYNADTLTAMSNLGMLTGRTTTDGSFTIPPGNVYELECYNFNVLTLTEAKAVLDDAMTNSKFIVPFIHRVKTPPNAGDWSIEDFQALIDHIVSNGYPCGSMEDLYALIIA